MQQACKARNYDVFFTLHKHWESWKLERVLMCSRWWSHTGIIVSLILYKLCTFELLWRLAFHDLVMWLCKGYLILEGLLSVFLHKIFYIYFCVLPITSGAPVAAFLSVIFMRHENLAYMYLYFLLICCKRWLKRTRTDGW